MFRDDVYEVYQAVWTLAEKDEYCDDNKKQYINMIIELKVIFYTRHPVYAEKSDKSIPKDLLRREASKEWDDHRKEYKSMNDD
jgi:hypothetical protein